MEAQLSARGGAQRGRGGGTGFSPVALQGAGVSFWTNIPHLARTSVQRLRSPASRKGPHHWVQDSELILILAGGCFSPRGSYGFAEASGVNVSSTLVTVITGDYVFSTTNTCFFSPSPSESWGRMPRHCLRFLGRETEALDPVRTMYGKGGTLSGTL